MKAAPIDETFFETAVGFLVVLSLQIHVNHRFSSELPSGSILVVGTWLSVRVSHF